MAVHNIRVDVTWMYLQSSVASVTLELRQERRILWPYAFSEEQMLN